MVIMANQEPQGLKDLRYSKTKHTCGSVSVIMNSREKLEIMD